MMKDLVTVLVAVAVGFAVGVASVALGEPLPHVKSNSATRSPATVAAYRKLHPCPGGVDKGSTQRCHGYVVDHRWPLCAGGRDETDNMQWQTTEDGRQKDKLEWYLCRALGTMGGKGEGD